MKQVLFQFVSSMKQKYDSSVNQNIIQNMKQVLFQFVSSMKQKKYDSSMNQNMIQV
jgi:hypothetical protein